MIESGQSSLAEIFDAHRNRLERIVAFRLAPKIQSRVDPSDILQEAYIEIARRYDEYLVDPKVSIFVWMRQITLQKMMDVHRLHFREKRDANREQRYLLEPTSQATCLSIARFLIDEIMSPSQAVIEAEETQRLQLALESMNEIDREVLALRHFEQLGNAQVAEILGLTPTAASNRYIRAAARLGEILAEIEPNPRDRKRVSP